MQDTVITNARLVNEGHIVEADLLIRGARIERIDGQIDTSGCTVIDADGRHLMPGMIDDQVHFREPGLTHKGDLESESIAAVAGGITSFMDMPNVKPATTTRAALADKYRLAAGRARANYAFYLGATNDNLAEIRALQPGEAYLLARRSVLNQVRLRSAIELLHAADESAPCCRGGWQLPSPNAVTQV